MSFTIRLITQADDLGAICAQMQPKLWGSDNEMTSYQPTLLKKFLAAGHLLLVAYNNKTIAGAAIAHELLHPAGEHSLYIHELDTHPDYRRMGVASELMAELNKLAKDRGLTEVLLGTETENPAANAFYNSLDPYEIEPSEIYAYKVK